MKQKAKMFFFVLILFLALVPVVLDHQFSEFFDHKIEKTDTMWRQPEVNCIKEMLVQDEEIALLYFHNDEILRMDSFTFYMHQYMFVPVILKNQRFLQQEKFILLSDSGIPDPGSDLFSDYQIRTCSDRLHVLTRGQ